MVTRGFPQLPTPQTLLAPPALALFNIERAFPLGAPPISIGNTLNQIAVSIPAIGVPPAGAAGGLPLPNLAGSNPLGNVPNVLASLVPQARPLPPVRSSSLPLITPSSRTGISA